MESYRFNFKSMRFHIDEFPSNRWVYHGLMDLKDSKSFCFESSSSYVIISICFQIDVISYQWVSIKSMWFHIDEFPSNRCDFKSMSFHQIDEFIMVRWNIQGTGIQDTINNYKRSRSSTQQSVLKPSTRKNKEVAIRGGGGRGVLCLTEK